MNIEILRTLIVAAELQNFHAVSRRMHMSQPAIAKRIRILEEALNSKLFVRSGKRMLLTKDGRLALTQNESFVILTRCMKTCEAGWILRPFVLALSIRSCAPG